MAAAWRLATVALPTFGDEAALFGYPGPDATARRLAGCGIPEVVEKDGPRGCVVWDGTRPRPVPAPDVPRPVDTTAATVLHEHFTDPVRIAGGRYVLPDRPGCSVTMKPASVAAYAFPGGAAWR